MNENISKLEHESTRESLLAEIDLFEQNANKLPGVKDTEILKKVRGIWVLSGDDTTNHKRLDYADRWLSAYIDILPDNQPPILIYNGTEEQNKNLNVRTKRTYIAPGINKNTLDQVKNFSFPPNLDIDNGYLGIISHSAHFPRILRFINNNQKIFQGMKVTVLPINLDNPENQEEMTQAEVKGTMDYIEKGDADIEPYPYILLDREGENE